MNILERIKNKTKDSYLFDCIEIIGDTLFFREDTVDSDAREQWDNYRMIRDDLADYGLKLVDPCVEHDCISGDLEFNGFDIENIQEITFE